MRNFLDGIPTDAFDPENDDTIEMVLNESAMQMLSQAAAPTEQPCPGPNPALKAPEVPALPEVRGIPKALAISDLRIIPKADVIPKAGANPEAVALPDMSSASGAPVIPEARPIPDVAAIREARPIPDVAAIPKARPIPDVAAIPEARPIADVAAIPELRSTPDLQTIAGAPAPRAPGAAMSTPRLVLLLTSVAVASALVTAVTYFAMTRPGRPAPVATSVVSIPPDPVTVAAPPLPPAPPPALQPPPELSTPPEPVRFVNPFDKKEVFEFPPGTSKAEARDAVAELLYERAEERQLSVRGIVPGSSVSR